jgi:predicted transglutaminase-like cysteine proteinase
MFPRVVLAFLLVAASASLAAAEPPRSTAAIAIEATTPPVGWVQFCQDHPRECDRPDARPAKARLDERRWKQLLRINRAVNDEIDPVSDLEQWGQLERWSFPVTGKGDCEEYVIAKRARLLAAGWPRQSLLITVVRDHKGDGHAVLTVVTDRGDFVLDNQQVRVKPWTETGYRFVKRQSQENPDRWVSLGGVDTGVLTAAR